MRTCTFTRATTAVRTSATTRAANRRSLIPRRPSGGRSPNGCSHLSGRLEGRGAVVARAAAGRHHRLPPHPSRRQRPPRRAARAVAALAGSTALRGRSAPQDGWLARSARVWERRVMLRPLAIAAAAIAVLAAPPAASAERYVA